MKRTIIILLAIITFVNISEARQPQRGYRGFFEWSSSLRTENLGYIDLNGNLCANSESTFYTGFTTSHGYQINQMFFVGGGFGMERCGKLDNWVAPLFVEGRADFKLGKYTPYADLRLGANIAEGIGAYFSPTIGYRFNWGRKMGINISAGLSLAGYKAEHYEGTFVSPDYYEIQYVATRHHVRPYFSFRIGIDF
ncbi:MAG: hypothetical protein K2N28_08335 [Muribaculaceae bacterium]|nr:hypothetical protein [Muribaculaceae bacterium]